MKESKNAMLPYLYQVQRTQKETHDTFTLFLTPANGKALAPFKPGQFNMLYIFGVGEVPISISGDPTSPEVLVHTTRIVGTVTRAMGNLKPGHTIGIRGPFGSSWPVETAYGDDVVIIAGGIGLAPLRPALYQILQEREKFGKVVLLYGARTPEDILYKRELSNLRKRFDLEIFVIVDRATGGWKGDVGVVTTLIPRAPFDPYHTTAFVCGPEVMMRYSVLGLNERGVPHDKIYVSLERNMKCGVGLCGHCQYGPYFICKDGPVFSHQKVKSLLEKREI